MKTNIDPQRVQAWSLFGMKPMHRALLRRTADKYASSFTGTVHLRFDLAWHVLEPNYQTSHSFSESLSRPGVMVIDIDELFRQTENREISDSEIDLLYQRSKIQIRLLWNWCERGRNDLIWCTELSFDGVIDNLTSLNQWVRVCLKRGRVIFGQPKMLLRDLRLPSLSPDFTSLD